MSKNYNDTKRLIIPESNGKIFKDKLTSDPELKQIFQSNMLYDRYDMDWFNKFNRFGYVDPYNNLGTTKEYLFFTKPDLHLCEPGTFKLNPEISDIPFFTEVYNRYPDVIRMLQDSVDKTGKKSYKSPFQTILSNSVKNSLEMPQMAASVTDTSATIYGTSINYRGDAFNSGEKHEFTLEFEDSKYLELYHLFKAYEEYEQLKKIGIITPPNVDKAPKSNGVAFTKYHRLRILHDQFAIFKFIVDEDYQDILYYAILQGVFFKSVPREAFSDTNGEGGLRYSVQFEAQFVFDMEPWILTFFNRDVMRHFGDKSTPNDKILHIYNENVGGTDGRWALYPIVVKKYQKDANPNAWLAPRNMEYKYQLLWRLS